MINDRPDPKHADSASDLTANPSPAKRRSDTLGRDLDQIQREAPEQGKRFFHRLGRFHWS